VTSLSPVVVPLDGLTDVRGVESAARMVRATGAPLRVISVVPDAAMARERTATISAAVARFDDIPLEIVVVERESVETAIAEAAVAASWVCMSTSATLLPHEGHLGSIAEAVVRMVERPVMLIGPKASGRIDGAKRLVVPVDGSPPAEYVMEAAAELASLLDLQAWVVTVVSSSQERQAEVATGAEYGVLESAYVRRLAREMGGKAQFEVLHGDDPAEAILDFADLDSIVAMSTHGRSGLSRIIAGSVTRNVVAGSPSPVLVVRPPHASR
jgi:nucleotide-binding universal stress UspA family protein